MGLGLGSSDLCCDPSIWPGLRSMCPTSPAQKGPARACPLPARRLSTEQPQKSHGGRHRQELLCRDPSRCWGGLPAEGHVPVWVPAPLFHRNYGRPWPSLSLGAESQGCSWGEAPERPRWCQGLGVVRQVVPCSWRDGGRGQVSPGAQGPRSSEGDGDCHFYQWGYLRCGTGFVALGLPGLALDKQHLPQPRPGAWEPLYLK